MNNVYEAQAPAVPNEAPANSFGYLQIAVAAARRALPVENALVSVYASEQEAASDLLYELQTNASGLTNQVSLPAPLAENSLNPERANPYNVFYVKIVAADFITRDHLPVQIFPGVLSDLIINMQTPI